MIAKIVNWIHEDDEKKWELLAVLSPYLLVYLVYPLDLKLNIMIIVFYYLIFWLFYSYYWEVKLKVSIKVWDSVKQVIEVNVIRFKRMKSILEKILYDYDRIPRVPKLIKALASFTLRIVDYNVDNNDDSAVEKIEERREKKSIKRFVIFIYLSFVFSYSYLSLNSVTSFQFSILFLFLFLVMLVTDFLMAYKNLIVVKFLAFILNLLLDKSPDKILGRIMENNNRRLKVLNEKSA